MQTAAAATTPSDGRAYPFQLRGSLQTMLSLRLISPTDPSFFPLLVDKVGQSPDFFIDAPVVLDLAPVADARPIDLDAFAHRLRTHRLVVIGVQNGSPAWYEEAARAGLARFGSGGDIGERDPGASRAAEPLGASSKRGPALVVHEPIRGGQQVVAPDGDLVVLGAVGHGAEIAAAGHIHIYGALRGRAFAGIEGDAQAMIFCDQLEAELISIAGVYVVNEAIDPRLLTRRVRIASDGERLLLSPVP